MPTSVKDINQFTPAKANVIFVENVKIQLVPKVYVQINALVINQHTAAKANVIFVENAPTKLVRTVLAPTNALVTVTTHSTPI